MRDYDAAERIATAALEQGKSDMHAQELEELRALVEACRNKRPKSE